VIPGRLTPRREPNRLPVRDGADALPRLPVVGDAGEPPPQLDHGGQFAALLKGGADRGGISLGDDEHRWSMGKHEPGG
jgi:hypothetical protein